jgi:hypothetical protein
LETRFGGFWDAGAITNVLEVPLKEHVIRTPFLTNTSLVSAPYRHNVDTEYGNDSMQRAYRWIYDSIKFEEPDRILEIKDKYLKKIDSVLTKRSRRDVDYSKFNEIKEYFELSHPYFDNFRKKKNV